MKRGGHDKLYHWFSIALSAVIVALMLPVPTLAQAVAEPMVAGGFLHTVGLKSDGTVVAVGYNVYGQLNVSGWSGITQVAAGVFHTVGLKSDGTVVAVGDNSEGQLNVSGWSGIIQVATGYWHTVGLKSDGTVVAVGDNGNGQLNVSGWKLFALYQKGYDDGYAAGQAALAPTIQDLNNQVAALTAQVSSLNSQISSLNAQIAQKDQALAAAQAQITQLQQTVNSLNTQLAQKDQTINSQAAQIASLTAQLAAYQDTLPPAGALHVKDVWAHSGKSVELTFSGYAKDEMSIARNGGGCGVSSAYLVINGGEQIPLTLNAAGKFSLTRTLDAGKDAVFTISLYAADTKAPTPNQGLVDEIQIVSPNSK